MIDIFNERITCPRCDADNTPKVIHDHIAEGDLMCDGEKIEIDCVGCGKPMRVEVLYTPKYSVRETITRADQQYLDQKKERDDERQIKK